MVGTGYSGNPNIAQISKEKSTGPKTVEGKLRCSFNKITTGERAVKLEKVMKEVGIKFKKTSEAVTLKKLFIAWFKSKSGKELNEIGKLDEVITFLESDVSVRVMQKLEKGIPLDDNDLKLLKLLKDSLEASHRMKFGDKHLNVHAGYEDIRQMMFDDNTRSKRD